MEFAQKLEFLINRDNVSRGKLARAVGVHTSTVTNWLSGKEPKIERLVKVAEFFNVPVAYLTGETDDPSDRSKTHWIELLSDKKEKPTTPESSELDPDTMELLEAWNSGDDAREFLLSAARMLKSRRDNQ